MSEIDIHFRHPLLLLIESYIHNKAMNSKLREIYGEGLPNMIAFQNWVNCFKAGDRTLEDNTRSKRRPDSVKMALLPQY
jgi:hypothetical protein